MKKNDGVTAEILSGTENRPVKAAKSKKKKVTPQLYIQHAGREISTEQLNADVLAALEARYGAGTIDKLSLYYKPEEGRVYCVVNNGDTVTVEI